jgi:hypothetical protein
MRRFDFSELTSTCAASLVAFVATAMLFAATTVPTVTGSVV